MIAYYIVHSPGPLGLVINLVIYLIIAIILFVILKIAATEFGVSQRIVQLIGLLLFLVLVLTLFVGCNTIGSVGVRGSYENERGQTYSGGVDIGLRDNKTVKPIRK